MPTAQLSKKPASQPFRSLAHAIRRRAVPLAQAQSTYKQDFVAVNTFITSVLTSKLPTLQNNPPDWQDFVTAYEQAETAALTWVNTVVADLLSVPQSVQTYNTVVSQLLQDAKTQATTLISQPSNQTALEILESDLSGLSSQLNLVITFISGAVTSIQNFGDVLPGMATQLQTIATKSANDANADQAKIAALNAAIQQLQGDIKALTAAIVALAIVDGITLTIGVVATIALWPVGAVVWFLLGPAVAVATYYIAMDAIKLETDKALITQKQNEMSGLTADVSTLQVLATNFSNMAGQTTVIESDLQAILSEWQTLESEVNAAIADIRAAVSDSNSANFTAALNDVSLAITEWNLAYNQAGSLTVQLQVNSAQLQIGMTPSQVQSTLAANQPVGIIQYYNGLSGQRRAA